MSLWILLMTFISFGYIYKLSETTEGRSETQEGRDNVSTEETRGWSPETGAGNLYSWM